MCLHSPWDTDSTQDQERGDGMGLCVDVFVLGLIPQELKWTGLSQWYAAILGSKIRMTWESVSFAHSFSPTIRLVLWAFCSYTCVCMCESHLALLDQLVWCLAPRRSGDVRPAPPSSPAGNTDTWGGGKRWERQWARGQRHHSWRCFWIQEGNLCG